MTRLWALGFRDIRHVCAMSLFVASVFGEGCGSSHQAGTGTDGGGISGTILLNVTAVAAASSHACALLVDGTVRCWGSNGLGELGNGSLLSSVIPRPVTGLAGVSALSTRGGHNCALLMDGTLQCWGLNIEGHIGNAADGSSVKSSVPVPFSDLTSVGSVSVGGTHGCGLLTDRSVECWGAAFYGQLGDGSTGSTADSPVPVRVAGLTGVVAVSAGGAHTCALLMDGTVRCWGSNFAGQLGNGSTNPTSSGVPIPVSGLVGIKAVSAGFNHTCALLMGGTVQCWGQNSNGQLGNNSIADSSVPSLVTALTNVIAISAGLDHTCAVLTAGSVRCWGKNTDGNLGNGSTDNSLVPVSVSALASATAVAAGDAYTCASLRDRTVQCWGRNTTGQLGNGSSTGSLVPVTVHAAP